jgi:hypothetical protein
VKDYSSQPLCGGSTQEVEGKKMDKRTRLYAQLLDASKQQRKTNIAEHKLRTGRIKRSRDARRKLRETKKEAKVPQVPLDFLAIGDSWFEYPLYNEILSFQNNAIVAKSQLGSMGNPPPQILNQALYGQATTAMLSWENQDKMITVLQDHDQWLNEETHLPDAILVSAGGDDLVGDQLAIYLDYGGGGLNLKRFQGVLDSVQASYFDLFAFRDIFAKGVPIIGHCYDYAIPNDVHPICTPSAWLWPSFNFAGYDYGDGLQIVTSMIDLFHDMLADLANDSANNFSFIDTRSTLTRDATQPNGWANEIHPWYPGFTALANKFLASLQAIPAFKNRI